MESIASFQNIFLEPFKEFSKSTLVDSGNALERIAVSQEAIVLSQIDIKKLLGQIGWVFPVDVRNRVLVEVVPVKLGQPFQKRMKA